MTKDPVATDQDEDTTHNPNDCLKLCATPRGCLLGDQCPWHLARVEQAHQECIAEVMEEIRRSQD